ncbi:glycosyltransferase family 4 protein [Patescibacteria group bacterium]|nr:glycosyltransferase family 4 protein [Patescibacteria group bacterium]
MNNNVLFLRPNWKTFSESWMDNMMDDLGKQLKVICLWNSGRDRFWKNSIPIICLSNYETAVRRLLSRLLGKKVALTPSEIINNVIYHYKINTVLVNYGDFALRFTDVWEKNRSIKVFVHFHGYDIHLDIREDNNPQKKHFSKDYKNGIRDLSQRAILLANSKYTKRILVKDFGILPERIVVKYLGVQIPSHKVVHKKNGRVQILHLGRLVDFKSPDRTTMAFERACEMGFAGDLVIAGDGELRDRCLSIRNKSKYSERIKILGAVDRPTAISLFKDTDIFTEHNIKGEKSHQTEALGVAILEAMSYGIPVVATTSGGPAETVVNNKTGILINPGDVEAQAKAFVKLGNDAELRSKMGNEGRKRVIKYFSQTVEAHNLRKILDN